VQAQTHERGFLNGVRTYYDKNFHGLNLDARFKLAVAKAIHREVWGPGVQTEKEAFEYANTLVLRAISNSSTPNTSDAGARPDAAWAARCFTSPRAYQLRA
jgi:hypothetical protein